MGKEAKLLELVAKMKDILEAENRDSEDEFDTGNKDIDKELTDIENMLYQIDDNIHEILLIKEIKSGSL